MLLNERKKKLINSIKQDFFEKAKADKQIEIYNRYPNDAGPYGAINEILTTTEIHEEYILILTDCALLKKHWDKTLIDSISEF
jgi:hypothetical protein